MLSHIDVHYLAAILTQIASEWGVEIELGDMVEDVVAEKGRDVDITARYRLPDGSLAEMHGIEVKDEKRPLDVQPVEQIIAKLQDMPVLTKHALVSSSGFTEPAKKKALHYGLDLYHFRDWDGTGLRVDMSQASFGGVQVSAWESVTAIPIIQCPSDGTPGELRFEISTDLMISDPNNSDVKVRLGDFLNSVCTDVINDVAAKVQNNPELAKEDRFVVDSPVNLKFPLQIPADGEMLPISMLQVKGVAVIKNYPVQHALKVLMRDEDNGLVAGCMVADLPDGSLWIFMASSTEGSLTARIISVLDRGKKKIYKEKMTPIPSEGPPLVNPEAG